MNATSLSFNPSDYPDLPLYNIQAVSAATAVQSITLRSWERRYGVPEPKRDVRGYRLYSQRDIAIVRWLKERVEEGIGISRAVNMLRVLETGRAISEPAPGGLEAAVLQARLVDGIRELDEGAVARAVRDALAMGTVEEVCLEVIQPALYRVGELWQGGDLTVTMEHFGSNYLRGVLTQLIRLSPAPLRPERVVVGAAPGEMHDIGALMLALFLRRRGFDVVYLGASIEPESFVQDVLRIRPTAVCLSASMEQSAATLASLYGQLAAQYHGFLAFGGRAYQRYPDLIPSTAGVHVGMDASEAAQAIESLSRGR